MKENGFKLTKERSRRYPALTITDDDYADDIAILANTPTQAESLLHNLERSAGGIGLHVKAKMEYKSFNQRAFISTLNGGHLKLMDKLTYLGISVSSTENDISSLLERHGQLSIDYRSHRSQTWPIK